MEKKHLGGLIAAPFTPMHPNGSLNLSIIPEYYEMLKRNRVRGAFICGSTGEGVSLSLEEKKQVAETWAALTANDRDFVVINLIGGTCIADCVELTAHAKAIGLYAVAFTSPYYFKPVSVKVIAKIAAEISNQVPGIPVYYYHIPVLTGVNFPMIDLLKEVGDIEDFAGIKFTYEDLNDYKACVQYQNGKYDILFGRDEIMLDALAVGAKGAVGSTFNYASSLYLDMIDAYDSGSMELAAALQKKACDMIDLLGKYGGIATGKAFMKLIGMDCGEFRLPVQNMSKEDFFKFKTDAEQLDFFDYCNKPAARASIRP